MAPPRRGRESSENEPRRTDINQPKTRKEIQKAIQEVAKLREFSDEEIALFEKVSEKKCDCTEADGTSCTKAGKLREILHSMSPEEFGEYEKKHAGFTETFLSQEKTFTTHGNEKVEWNIGLRHLIRDKKVRTIKLLTRVDNLKKAGKERLKNDSSVEKVQRNGEWYVVRESRDPEAGRDEEGNFYDQFGYMAIFEGDKYEIGITWTDEQFKEYEERELAKRKNERSKIVADLKISVDGLTDEQVDQKIEDEYKKKTLELFQNEGEWTKMMDEACETFGLPKTGLTMSIMASMMQYESGMNPQAENDSSKAYGLGQFLTGTRRSMYRTMKAKGLQVPDNPDGIFKYDPRWQIFCLAQLLKSNAERLSGSGINVFSGNARDIAFLYLAHHDGGGGVSMFINWWKSNGRPDDIPKFPHGEEGQQLNDQYHVAGFQKSRGVNGTNKILDYAYKVGNRAIQFQNNPNTLMQQLKIAEAKFERQMTA